MNWTRFTVGFLTFIVAHVIEVTLWQRWFGGDNRPWFLNSGRAAALTISGMFVASMIATADPIGHRCGTSIAAGGVTAMGIVLLLTGQSSLFPIVLRLRRARHPE
jgi:hypothetical protein